MFHTPAFKILTFLTSVLILAATAQASDIVSLDGREVRLNPDGSWEFTSEDRIANTPDGRRVRLKMDNTWEYIGNAPLKSEQQVRTEVADILLTKVEIQVYEEKVHKSKRVITQTLFHLTIDISPLAEGNFQLSVNDLSSIVVKDDKGTTYPVLQVSPGHASFKPGTKTQLIIRTAGSPSWLYAVKTIELILPEGFVSGIPGATFSQRYVDMETVKVDSLPEW